MDDDVACATVLPPDRNLLYRRGNELPIRRIVAEALVDDLDAIAGAKSAGFAGGHVLEDSVPQLAHAVQPGANVRERLEQLGGRRNHPQRLHRMKEGDVAEADDLSEHERFGREMPVEQIELASVGLSASEAAELLSRAISGLKQPGLTVPSYRKSLGALLRVFVAGLEGERRASR